MHHITEEKERLKNLRREPHAAHEKFLSPKIHIYIYELRDIYVFKYILREELQKVRGEKTLEEMGA